LPPPAVETPDILVRIVDRIRVEEGRRFESFSPLSFPLVERTPPRDIAAALAASFTVIAEIKKGSPSRGIIRADFDPVRLARDYETGGAGAISVVTEKNYFFGAKEHLRRVRDAVALPVLRKDFIIHPFQVFESFNLGADFILLIAAILSGDELGLLVRFCRSLGMEALVEVHDDADLERALGADPRPRIIGVNNRNLRDFSIDWTRSLKLRGSIPAGIRVISESGIGSAEQLRALKAAGFAGALVGEHLLKQERPGQALKEMIHGPA
jgi:indole-3-glycerol phosphate synthase